MSPIMPQPENRSVYSFGRAKYMKSDIIVQRGILSNLQQYAKDVIPAHCHASKSYLITDSVVNDILADMVMKGLTAAGLKVHKIVVPADAMDESGESSGERYKTLDVFSKVADEVLEKGVDKRSCIISLGGGVINNICGFLASAIYRGLTLVHFTTTMMGQADAAIDFKQAVNHHCGKNLLGSYYPASIIVCDPNTLLSLSRRHILNGLSECIKHAVCQSVEMVRFITENPSKLHDPEFLEKIIQTTLEHKCPTLTDYESSDFNEMCPQYGHAVAHAIEHLSWKAGYGPPLLHGEACSIGMCVTAEVARIMGICTDKVVDRHYEVFEAVGLPVYLPANLPMGEVLKKLTYDKHYLASKPTMGLLIDIGKMYQENGVHGIQIEEKVLRAAMQANLKRHSDPVVLKRRASNGTVVAVAGGANKIIAGASRDLARRSLEVITSHSL